MTVRGHIQRRTGATLLEVALVIIILGVGITAMLGFVSSASSANKTISEDTTALTIAKAAHEWAQMQTLAELKARFPGANVPRVYTPAELLDGDGNSLAGDNEYRKKIYSGYTEKLEWRYRDDDLVAKSETDTAMSRTAELTVIVYRNNKEIRRLTKLYADAGY